MKWSALSARRLVGGVVLMTIALVATSGAALAAGPTPPGAPSIVSTTPSDSAVTVAFAAPDSAGSSPILSYTVSATDLTTPNPNPLECIYVVASDAGMACEVQGLTNGDQYTFTVNAYNADGGVGPDSAPSAAVTPAALPGTPTAVSAKQGNGHISVSWTAPASDGGSPITHYTATAVGTTHTCTAQGTTTCDVAGLTTGTSYTFTVTATTAAGTSPASKPSTAVTEVTVPSAPTGVKALRSASQQIKVKWKTPTTDGSSPIIDYVATATDQATNATLSCTHSAVIPFNNCLITNLINGDTYIVTVVAENVVGDSAASAPSNPIIPATTGFAPINVTGTPGNHQVTVSWTPSPDDGGLPATTFTVSSSGTAAQSCTYVVPAAPAVPTDRCVITGLTNGTTYTFTVVATNDVGPSPPSSPPISVTPATLPGAPSAVVGQRGNASATVHWSAPASNGGSAVSSYTVTASGAGAQTCTYTVPPSGTPVDACVVHGLTNGKHYTFTVTATNVIGTGPASLPSSSVSPGTAPDPPTGATAVAGDGRATVSWTPPASNGGRPITSYTVTAVGGSASCTYVVPTTTPSYSCVVKHLTDGTPYSFAVTATNSLGTSIASDPSNSVTPAIS